MSNHAELYDHSVAGILARLTHGILQDSNQRALEGSVRADAPGNTSTRKRSWVNRLDSWFWKQDMKRREAYLAQSTDIFDLERRMRRLERSGNRAP